MLRSIPYLILLVLIQSQGNASLIIVDNTSNHVAGRNGVSGPMATVNVLRAQQFTMQGFDYALAAVEIDNGTPSAPLGSFELRIHADDSGIPGMAIDTLSGTANPVSGMNKYLGYVPLSPNTPYWLVADVTTGAGSYSWTVTADSHEVSNGATLADNSLVQINGGNWNTNPNVGLTRMTATAVPEPSSFALLGIVGTAAIGLRRVILKRR